MRNDADMIYTSTFIRMAVSYFFMASSFGAFFLLPLFIVGHGGSKADTGILMGAFGLSSVLCRPWTSDMIDRIGRKKSYTLGSIIMVVLPLAYLPFEGELRAFYLPLLLVRIVHGVGLAVLFTAAFTYVSDIIPDDRLNEGIGMFGVTGLTGTALGPALEELVIREFGFPAGFLFAALLAAAGFVVQIPLPESYVRKVESTRKAFFLVLRARRTMIIAMVALLFGLGISAANTFVAPYAKEKQIVFISLFFLCSSATAILTRVLGGKLADRLGEERIIPSALLVAGTGFILLLFLRSLPTLALAGILIGYGHGFLFPCIIALSLRNQPAEIRGKVTGVSTGAMDAGILAGSVMLGYIGEWGGFQALFLTTALVLFAGYGACNWAWRRRESVEQRA
ncbi:MAG: MFS transporter [Thermodesulfobacteriota bacterium]